MSDDREQAAKWAREVLADPRTAVLDTETTGLHDAHACEIVVVEPDGKRLVDTLVRPPVPVEPGARRIHGITDEMLAGAPSFDEVWKELRPVLTDRRIVVYNADYDAGVISNGLRAIGRSWMPRWECAMKWYAQWRGEWDEYHGNYRWHRLNGGHRAGDDCDAVYERLREMAAE